MALQLSFTEASPEQIQAAIILQQKIAAIDNLLAGISDERAIAEADWRKKENFLKTEQGKLQIELRSMTKGTLTDTGV